MFDKLSDIVQDYYIEPTHRILRNIQETTLENERENKEHAIQQGRINEQIRLIAQRQFACRAY